MGQQLRLEHCLTLSSTSFITKHLSQCLLLVRRNHKVKIRGISATSNQPPSCVVTNFSITCPDNKGKMVLVEALMLFEDYIQSSPMSSFLRYQVEAYGLLATCRSWFGTPGKVDLLLGADTFSYVPLHNQQFGCLGLLSVFKTHFSWVLAGAVHTGHTSQGSTNQCYILTIEEENLKMENTLEILGRIEVLGSQRIPVTLASQRTFEWQECTNWIVLILLLLAGGVFALERGNLISVSRVSCEGGFWAYTLYSECVECEKVYQFWPWWDPLHCFSPEVLCFLLDSLSSANRQATVRLLCGHSAGNQWVLFVGILSRQPHYQSYNSNCPIGVHLSKLLVR